MELSIIIVHYRNKDVLFDCLESIFKEKPRFSFEVIVVDNDEVKTVEKELLKKFPKTKYIKSLGNIGFGAGNNLGVKNSSGKFLFFLNPDTKVISGSLEALVNFLKENRQVGVVAPLLCDSSLKPFVLQGSGSLNPLTGIFAFSFLNKIFPNNRVSKKYFLSDWNKKNQQEVRVVPGTALVIKREIFDQIKGFDEKFFLYFEESDLCKRVSEKGFKIFIIPEAKVIHLLSQSTPKDEKIKKIFRKSRFYYFQKHYGLPWAIIVNFINTFSLEKFLLMLILCFALFLRFYKLPELMSFGGDAARDFIVSRDITLKGQIPLLGCPSSVPWLHQGALFIYLLSVVLWLGKYNPLFGGYFVGVLGVLEVLGVFFLGKKLFSAKTGLLAAFFYAASPLIVIFDRLPYHLSLISLLTILFFLSLYYSFKEIKFIIVSSLIFGLLMQLELSNLVLFPIWLLIIFEQRKQINIRILIFSLSVFFIPWIPKFIYDFNNGFTQTLGFVAWVFHKLPPISLFLGEGSSVPLVLRLEKIFIYLSRIIFWRSVFLSAIVFVFSILFLGKKFNFKERKNQLGIYLILLWVLVPMAGFIIQGSPSESYVPILFAPVSLLLAGLTGFVPPRRRLGGTILFLGFIFLGIFNAYFIVSNNYFILTENNNSAEGYNLGQSFDLNKKMAKIIVNDSQGKRFNIMTMGAFAEFPSSKLNLTYLTWYFGNEESEKREKLIYFVYNNSDQINIKGSLVLGSFPYMTILKKEIQ